MFTSLLQPLFCPGQLPIHFLIQNPVDAATPLKRQTYICILDIEDIFFGRAIISVKTSLNLDRTREFDPSPLIWPVS